MFSLSALALAAVGQSKPIDYDFYFSDGLSGTSHYEKDGQKITSTTKLKLQGFDIDSSIVIGITDKGPTTLDFHETMKQDGKVLRSGDIVCANGKAKVTNAGKTVDVPVTLSYPIFTNFHPGVSQDLFSQIHWNEAKAQTVPVFMPESLSKVNFTVTPGEVRNVVTSDGSVQIRLADVAIATVKLQMAFTASGEYLGMDVPSQKLRAIRRGYERVFSDPLSGFSELSQPEFGVKTSVVEIPMRDGTKTMATVLSPEKEGKYPVILERTPYNRKMASDGGNMYARRGYVVVVQDVRGTGESKGKFDPMVNERKDGYDTIDWISKQSWCDGNVGMIGASYVGYVQWAAAVEHHPALKCIIPQVSPPSSAMWNLPYENGVFTLLSNLWWLRIVDNPEGQNLLGAMNAITNLKGLLTLPLDKADDKLLGFNSTIFSTWLKRDTLDKWDGWNFDAEMKSVKIPALHISGWFDGDEIGTQRNWDLVTGAGNDKQWLIYGPWTHFFNTSTKVGNYDFGKDAVLELDSLYLRWFDTWLKGKQVGLNDVPKVRYFAMGENKWHTSTNWPPTESKTETLKFEFGKVNAGPKSTARLVSTLSKDTSYKATYDPSKEKIETDSLNVGDDDNDIFVKNSALTKNQIVLRSAPFDRDRLITGPVTVEFDFKSSASDTDFYASAFDEDTQKRLFIVFRPGKLKASYIGGLDKQRFLKVGQTYHAKLLLWDGACLFKKGHRLTVLITNSLFPGTARNLGTTDALATGTKSIAQENTILSRVSNPGFVKFRVQN